MILFPLDIMRNGMAGPFRNCFFIIFFLYDIYLHVYIVGVIHATIQVWRSEENSQLWGLNSGLEASIASIYLYHRLRTRGAVAWGGGGGPLRRVRGCVAEDSAPYTFGGLERGHSRSQQPGFLIPREAGSQVGYRMWHPLMETQFLGKAW